MKTDYAPTKLDLLDLEELACKITGLDYDEIDADTSVIEDALCAEFGIELDGFVDIVNHLLPLIDVGKSPITEKKYKGFSDQKSCWLAKIEVK